MKIKFCMVLLSISNLATCQRRITNGTSVSETVNTNFMVYLVGASLKYADPGWMCGGCIIHPSLVLTSAACLRDVRRIYVIGGYRKYVSSTELDQDSCTKEFKKKITSYITSLQYGALDINQGNKQTVDSVKYAWTKFDIGIARVDTPFDSHDRRYEALCSYRPGIIAVNIVHKKFEKPGTSAVAFGWGHAAFYRPDGDDYDYNEVTLKYTSTLIVKRTLCMLRFESPTVQSHIGSAFICADGAGLLDPHGRITSYDYPKNDMCQGESNRRDLNDTNIDDPNDFFDTDAADNTNLNDTSDDINISNTRRNGICQNDHGSPLVTWIGGKVTVIGVASAFHVNQNMECVAPYLYTSTFCVNKIIQCVLAAQTDKTVDLYRRSLSHCNKPGKTRDFKLKEKNVKWNDTHFDQDVK